MSTMIFFSQVYHSTTDCMVSRWSQPSGAELSHVLSGLADLTLADSGIERR